VTPKQAFEHEINECIRSLEGDVLLIKSYIDRGIRGYTDDLLIFFEKSIEILKESL